MTMRFHVGHATDTGRRRTQNQDNLAVFPDLGLFVVADGMGGHQGGETASAMAVEIIPKVVKERVNEPEWSPRETIAQAITIASQAIFDRAESTPGLSGMGTTTTALLFHGKSLYVGHVGDSRCYMIRDGALWQATRDHSLVAEKVRAGLITREQAKTDKMKNVITRSVGFEKQVPVEVYERELTPGDLFLICSDGLSGLVEESDILNAAHKFVFSKLEHDNADLQKAVLELIAQANHHGGDDNITAVMIEWLGST